MWVGQQLADGLDFWGFLGSLILGGIILGIYTGLLGYVGAKTGLSLDLLSQRAFGEKGSYLPSAMTSFTPIGWFGVGSFVSGGTATPNFARFAKNGKAGAITTVVAFFIGNSLMFFFGAISYIFVGGNDIFEVIKDARTNPIQQIETMASELHKTEHISPLDACKCTGNCGAM